MRSECVKIMLQGTVAVLYASLLHRLRVCSYPCNFVLMVLIIYLACVAPGVVQNVQVYVYHPRLNSSSEWSALVVWDALNRTEAGGEYVNCYKVQVLQQGGGDVSVSPFVKPTCIYYASILYTCLIVQCRSPKMKAIKQTLL